MSTPAQAGYYRPRRPRSMFGPLVLIAIGVVFLLRNFGMISGYAFWAWFSKYWPVLLILLGLVKLAEYMWARQTGNPPPRTGAGAIVFIVFFVIFGLAATKASRVDWRGVGNEIGVNNDPDVEDFFNGMFGSRYDFTDSFSQPVNAATQIKILAHHGDIKITASADDQVHAIVQKTLRSGSEQDANKLNEATHPKFDQQGSIAVLDLTSGNYQHGQFDLDLQLPRAVALAVSTHHGDITVSQRDGNIDLTTDHGDISLDQVKGDASIHLRHGSITAKDVGGNVTLDGNISNTNLSDVRGTVSMTGTYWGDMELARIAKQVHFNTSRTDLQFNRLDGEFNMQPDDLRANGLTGPFRLETKSKTVHLEDTTGDIHIQNRNASIELHPKSVGAIDVSNVHGEIKIALPANAAFQLDAQSLGGDIETDFGIKVDNSRRDATARGAVGKGGPTINLRTERGTIEVVKQ
jgi:DUF4097 and DUF4098 domain-containing protein YvlB